MRDLAPGIRSIFTRFETAARTAEAALFQHSDYNLPEDERDAAIADAEREKQTMMRALIRLQNKGPEDVEQIKRDLRKFMTIVESIYTAPDQASRIIEATKAMARINEIKRTRAAHPYHAGVAAFEAMLKEARKHG